MNIFNDLRKSSASNLAMPIITGKVFFFYLLIYIYINIYWFIYIYIYIYRERDRDRERDGHIDWYCSTYSCIHWLILECALTGDRTLNLGILGRCSNQLSYLAREGLSSSEILLLLTNSHRVQASACGEWISSHFPDSFACERCWALFPSLIPTEPLLWIYNLSHSGEKSTRLGSSLSA